MKRLECLIEKIEDALSDAYIPGTPSVSATINHLDVSIDVTLSYSMRQVIIWGKELPNLEKSLEENLSFLERENADDEYLQNGFSSAYDYQSFVY